MKKSFRYRLYPTKKQQRHLNEWLALWCEVYNAALDERKSAYRMAGLDALAQVDLDERQNDHQPLRELGSMASAVLDAVSSRLIREGRLRAPLPEVVERPPLRTLRVAA